MTTVAVYGPTLTGDPADAVDLLMTFTGGEVLRYSGTGGEYDMIREGHVSAADVRRLKSARLISTRGLPPDELAHVAHERGWGDGSSDAFLAFYLSSALSGLDYRRAARSGASRGVSVDDSADPDTVADWVAHVELSAPVVTEDEWRDSLAALLEDTAPQAGTVPASATEWVERLVYAPKRALLVALIAHRWQGAGAPVIPPDEWAVKLSAQFSRRYPAS